MFCFTLGDQHFNRQANVSDEVETVSEVDFSELFVCCDPAYIESKHIIFEGK